MTGEALATVLAYHRLSAHDLDRWAPGPERLNWADEPEPWRLFAGAPRRALPLPGDEVTPPYEALFQPGSVPPEVVGEESLSRFFYYSLAVSAWKAYGGARWALRVNPSSGNLHPTEAYLLTGRLDPPGLYHYLPREHALELRGEVPREAWVDAGLPPEGFVVCLTSIPWREAWKYGERAYRYCLLDEGHALAALRLAGLLLGWEARRLAGATDPVLTRLLGLDQDHASHPGEPEVPVGALAVGPPGGGGEPTLKALFPRRFFGRANRLSARHRRWPGLEEALAATRREAPPALTSPEPKVHPPPKGTLPAGLVLRRRRSALAFDGRTALPAEAFRALLARLRPETTLVPRDVLGRPPRVHVLFFLHRVEGFAPGLYLLLRDRTHAGELQAALRQFSWEPVPEEPDLYGLAPGDWRREARLLSCDQQLAADGALAALFLARFLPELEAAGPAAYRDLHWEAGLLGHLVYLEAEAQGYRATGMGCFFDPAVHRLLGLTDETYRDLYHIAVGKPVEDPRLTTLPAYPRSASSERER